MKVKKIIIPLLLISIALFTAFGCANNKAVERITDIVGYENMLSGGDKIEVHFENGEKYGFDFIIEDKTDIDEIVNLVLNTKLVNVGNSPVAPGDNTDFTVYQGDNIYGIALSGVMSNGNRYAFSTNDLRDKICEVAEAKGAFGI